MLTRDVGLVLIGSLLLAACGGGGGGGPTGSTIPPASGWVQGQFSPAADFAALCVAPRTGTDPVSQQPYPDKQGSLLDELNWLRSWNNELYLWFDEVVDQNPASFTSDASYFAVLKTTATDASGAPKDKFHFTYPTGTWESLETSGVDVGYGADFDVVVATPPRQVVLAYTEPGSPAAGAPASLARGAQILTVDGVDLVNANDQASVNALNAGLAPQTVGESHSFSVHDLGATTPRTVTLVAVNVTETPVQNVQTVTAADGSLVGYMLFNDHIATSEAELVTAFNQLKTAAVTDLVLDIRYNGGGLLDIASEVAYMIAGPTVTNGQTFDMQQFNSRYPATNPVTGEVIVPVDFHSTAQGFSVTAGQALPSLNLARVFVLTTASTCSASEAIINSLQGVNVQVIQIGSTTCGKPYGFYPQDNCGTTYFSIEFQGVNAKGFGSYPNGFTPQNTVAVQGVLVPGCSVADDFSHALGDSAEGLFASALAYRSNGMCPAPPAATGGTVIKSFWHQNRIQRPPPTPP
jgi:hypothetical protein